MDDHKITLLIKTTLFEWKPFLPIKPIIETFMTHIKHKENGEQLLTEFQTNLAKATIDSELFKTFPPCPSSTVTYIKRLLLVLEECGIEGNSTFYDFVSHADGLQSKREYYKTYFDDDGGHVVSLVEKRELICDGTTGLRTWQAGKFLSKWMLENTDWLPQEKEYTILELGSGVGFTGISLLKNKQFSPTCMIMTDHHDSVLHTLHQNVKANLNIDEHDYETKIKDKCTDSTKLRFPIQYTFKVESSERQVIVDKLDWECFLLNETKHERFTCDIVIGADIVFDKSVIPYLVNVIVKCLTDLGTEKVILANCVRNEDTDRIFMQNLENKNLSFEKQNYSLDEAFTLNLYVIRIYQK